MRFLSLFAGIGGFDLGLERAGWECVGQVEIEPFCQKVLAKHWPNVWRHDDVRTVTAELVRGHCGEIDAIVGGFPCQDISYAGKGEGIDGARSGLWSEYYRLICEVRPRFVIVENVAALLGRGMGRVLGDLATCGYDAEWSVLSACAIGASHSRERVFLVAYSNQGLIKRRQLLTIRGDEETSRRYPSEWGQDGQLIQVGAEGIGRIRQAAEWWRVESGLDRMAHGVPARMDRLGALGNAIVPQCAEVIGRAIMQMDGGER